MLPEFVYVRSPNINRRNMTKRKNELGIVAGNITILVFFLRT